VKTILKNSHPLTVWIVLGALVILNLSVHAPLLIKNYFGESDSARKANSCILASYEGDFSHTEYTLHSSPLYMDLVRYSLKADILAIGGIPFALAVASLISSAVVTGALFLFVFRLTHSVSVASGASFILQLIPTFWLNSLYGFPTIVALAFLMLSLVLFQGALGEGLLGYKYVGFLGAAILYVLAVLTKVDSLLASAIYFLPLWRSDQGLKSKVIWAGVLVIFSSLVFLLFTQYEKSLVAGSAQTGFSWSFWSAQWPFRLGAFFSKVNIVTIVCAVGILSIPVAFAGLVVIGKRKEWRSTIFWLLMSGLPLPLFWGMRPGNSARHNFISTIPLCIILAMPLIMEKWKKIAWAALLIVMCLTNYFFFPAHASTLLPSGRLLPSTHLLTESMKSLHLSGRTIAHLPYEKVAVVGGSEIAPFFRFELLRSGKMYQMERGRVTPTYNFELHRLHRRNESRQMEQTSKKELGNAHETQVFLWIHREHEFRTSDSKHVVPDFMGLVGQGYFLVAGDNNATKMMANTAELRGRWKTLDHLMHPNQIPGEDLR